LRREHERNGDVRQQQREQDERRAASVVKRGRHDRFPGGLASAAVFGGTKKTPTTDPKTWSLAAQISLLATAALIGLVAVLLSLEGAIALMLRSDAASGSDVWKRARREYYMRIERHVLQYLPECARFDRSSPID
jgi:hypothetical protein